MHAARPQPPPRAGGGAGSPPCRGLGGEGGGGRVGGGGGGRGAHCTALCVLRHTALCCALHYIACVAPRCTVRAALHGAVLCCAVHCALRAVLHCSVRRTALLCACVLYCTMRVALLRSECGAPHGTCVRCPSAPCVLGCATAHCACRAAQHCACGAALPRSRLVCASRGGRGTRDRQLASVVAGARTPGRERDT